MQMRHILYSMSIVVSFLLVSCSGSETKSEKGSDWQGRWEATWETDSASYIGVEGITDYTMPGNFTFNGEYVTIKGYGFEGCVFSKDTLDHTLQWKVSGDSLILINDESTPGMVYTIVEKSDSFVRLQLMDDIFLSLEK